MLEPIFIRRKIKFIQEDLKLLESFRGISIEEAARDPIKWNALVWILAKVIGRAVDINRHLIAELADKKIEPPPKHRETFLLLPRLGILTEGFAEKICRSADFRNRIIHEYNDLDKEKVWETVDEAIEQYAEYSKYILDFLDKPR